MNRRIPVDSADKFHEYVSTVSSREKIEEIKEWLDSRAVMYSYVGYTSDTDDRYESHWWIATSADRIMFTLKWGRCDLDE